jgi:hypothetical protein
LRYFGREIKNDEFPAPQAQVLDSMQSDCDGWLKGGKNEAGNVDGGCAASRGETGGLQVRPEEPINDSQRRSRRHYS